MTGPGRAEPTGQRTPGDRAAGPADHTAGAPKAKGLRAGRGRRRTASVRGRGPLLVITVLFVASAVVRIGLVTDARAREPQQAAVTRPAEPAAQEASALLAALREREERLAAAEAALADRRAAQELMDAALDRKLAALTEAEEALADTIARAETAAEDDLSKLTAVYENMKPANAAALFEAMAPDFAAGFLARMRPEAAAGIMAGLTPQAAYSISALLAGRNARVPTQ